MCSLVISIVFNDFGLYLDFDFLLYWIWLVYWILIGFLLTLAFTLDFDLHCNLAALLNMASEALGSDPVPSTSSGGPRQDDVEEPEFYEPVVNRHLYTSEVVTMWNLTKVVKELSTREQCVAFAENNDLVAKEKICRTHRVPMKVTYSTNRYVLINLQSWNADL